MNRMHVFALRLIPTLFALGIVVAAVYGLWYPGGHARLAAVGLQVAVLAVSAVVLGPVLSTVVFRPGKRGLRVDLAVLAGLELAAVLALATLLYLRQPAYAVFAVDRFEVVRRSEVNPAALATFALAARPGHAPRLVYAAMPADPAALDRLLDETVFHGLPDIDRRPAFWEPYAAGVAFVRARGRPLGDLLGRGDPRRPVAQRWLEGRGASADDYLFLPVRGRRADAAMLVHARIGYPVGMLAVDPWR